MIQGKLVYLRLPHDNEHTLLVRWRNESSKFFFSEESVSLRSHLSWYERVRLDVRQRFFVVVPGIPDITDLPSPDRRANPRQLDKPVGTIGLKDIDFVHGRAEYGRFLISEERQRRGYGEEALRLLLDYAFNTLRLNKVYGEILEDNLPALALCKVLGFKAEGKRVAHVFKRGRYLNVVQVAILKSEFEDRKE